MSDSAEPEEDLGEIELLHARDRLGFLVILSVVLLWLVAAMILGIEEFLAG